MTIDYQYRSPSLKTTTDTLELDVVGPSDFGAYACIAYFDSLTNSIESEDADLTEISKYLTTLNSKITNLQV